LEEKEKERGNQHSKPDDTIRRIPKAHITTKSPPGGGEVGDVAEEVEGCDDEEGGGCCSLECVDGVL